MYWEQRVRYAGCSDVGLRRKNNQDSFTIQVCEQHLLWRRRGHLFLVADGMGGHAVGELASKITTDLLPLTYFKFRRAAVTTALKGSIETANQIVFERGSLNREFQQMGTTCSCLILSPQGAVIGHVGDSRVYRIRDGEIQQLTFDHSLQWELIRRGEMTPEQAALQPKNVITRSLGPDPAVEVDIEGPHPIHARDTYVLCSDGLTNHLTDSEIGVIASQLPPEQGAQLLIHIANLRGGTDNITVIIAQVGDIPEGASASELDSPEDEDEDTTFNWLWLAGVWLSALVFALGLSLYFAGHRIGGTTLAALAFCGGAGLYQIWKKRPAPEVIEEVQGHIGAPYRTFPARLTPEFTKDLHDLGRELVDIAVQEKWVEDVAPLREALQATEALLQSGKVLKAFRESSKVVDRLMALFRQQRRDLDHVAKWGKKPARRD